MTDHMDYLERIAATDVMTLREKERTYGGSWKKRGGVGAFMMLARKMDRLENIAASSGYDIFDVIRREGTSGKDGDLIAEIRDLRCYLMLVEAEMTAQHNGSVHIHPGATPDTPCIEDTETDAMRSRTLSISVGGSIDHPAPFGFSSEQDA